MKSPLSLRWRVRSSFRAAHLRKFVRRSCFERNQSSSCRNARPRQTCCRNNCSALCVSSSAPHSFSRLQHAFAQLPVFVCARFCVNACSSVAIRVCNPCFVYGLHALNPSKLHSDSWFALRDFACHTRLGTRLEPWLARIFFDFHCSSAHFRPATVRDSRVSLER